MIVLNKRIIAIGTTIVLLLLIPLVAMQFTDEVNWTFADFVIGGFLLTTAGVLCEIVIRKFQNRDYRIVALIVVLAILVLLWAELAVGIFDSPIAGS